MNNLDNSKFFSFELNIADVIIKKEKIYVLLKKNYIYKISENQKEKFILHDDLINKKFIIVKNKPLLILIEKENGNINILKLKKNKKPILIYKNIFERKIGFQISFFFQKFLCLNQKKGIFFYEIDEEFKLKIYKGLKVKNFSLEYLINFYFFKKNDDFIFLALNDKNEFLISKNSENFVIKFMKKESPFSFQYFLFKKIIRIFFITDQGFYYLDFNLAKKCFSDFQKLELKNIKLYKNFFLDINYYILNEQKKLLLFQNSDLNIFDFKFNNIKTENFKITKLIDKSKFYLKNSKKEIIIYFKNKLLKFKSSIF